MEPNTVTSMPDNQAAKSHSDDDPFFPAGTKEDNVVRFTSEFWLSESIVDHFIAGKLLSWNRAVEVADRFIKNIPDPAMTPYWDQLFFAAISNDPEGIRAAIAEGCDPNEKDSGEWPPLTAAVEACALESVKALLDAGADPNEPSVMGWRPLDQALHLERSDIAIALLDAGAQVEGGKNCGMAASDILRSHWAPADVLAWLTAHGQTI